MTIKSPCDDGVVVSAHTAEPCEPAARPWILLATILGSSMAFIDGTVVNVALPALQRDLGATATDLQWVVEAYALLFSALLLVGGSLGDQFGRRRTYAIGIGLFTLMSVGCGLARSMPMLILARALQGVGAALLVPGSLALISASFPENERGRAIGTWSGFSAITAALGPVLGGWLIEHLSWRWAFLMNVPIAAEVLVLLAWKVPESRDPEASHRLDWAGAALVTVGLGGIIYGLIESSRLGWDDRRIVIGFIGGIAALAAFLLVESRSKSPMLPLSLFRSRTFAGANLLTLFLYGALSATMFFLPLNLIQVHHYSATAAGAAILPLIVIIFLFSRWSGGLLDRYGARLPLVVGPTIAAAGLALMAIPGTTGTYWVTFFPAVLVLGCGMAVTVAPLTTTVMNAVGTSHAGIASGVNNAVSRVAGLLAIALMGLLMVRQFNAGMDQRMDHMSMPPAMVEAMKHERAKLGAAEAPAGADAGLRRQIALAVAQSFVAGFRWVALVSAALALASAITAAMTSAGRERKAPG
jgi:EmrB/QacA subfamily drug resistance transporter